MGVTQRQDIYDVRGRLSERRYSIDGGASILSYEHTYSNGNRELRRSIAWGTHAPAYDLFLYDGNGGVRWAEYGSSSTVSDSPVLQLPEGLTHSSTVTGDYSEGGYGRSFNYRSGNWDEVEDVTFRGEFWPSGFGIPTGTVSATERVLDPLGNVVRVENPRFTTLGLVYDGLSRLRRAVRADGVELEYIYRVDGLLQEKIRRCHGVVGCTDGHEVFVYDHRGLLLEIRDGQVINPVIARYYYAVFDGEVPIAMDLREEGGTNMIRYYSLSDRQGSIVGLMGEDGTVVERVAYDAWGVPWVTTSNVQTVAPYASSLGNRLLFQSHLWDPDVDLYFMRARVFDPFRGEFLQRDPSGYADSVNMYAGFANDPVNRRDPSGMKSCAVVFDQGAMDVVGHVALWLERGSASGGEVLLDPGGDYLQPWHGSWEWWRERAKSDPMSDQPLLGTITQRTEVWKRGSQWRFDDGDGKLENYLSFWAGEQVEGSRWSFQVWCKETTPEEERRIYQRMSPKGEDTGDPGPCNCAHSVSAGVGGVDDFWFPSSWRPSMGPLNIPLVGWFFSMKTFLEAKGFVLEREFVDGAERD